MIARVETRVAADANVLFTDLLELEWEGGTIKMVGKSGDYTAHGHMSVGFAAELYTRLGRVLAQNTNIVTLHEPKRKKRKKKKR